MATFQFPAADGCEAGRWCPDGSGFGHHVPADTTEGRLRTTGNKNSDVERSNTSGASTSSKQEESRSDMSGAETKTDKKVPMVILVIGMAGTGKTSLMQRINSYLHEQGKPPYIVNLDPAVTYMPYGANIDIRDTVDYKNVMKQYKLGPNGGILTASNLFATRFDQVIGLCESKTDVEYILVDTPGQIEIFTWSASGAIITEAFASTFPTAVLYVCDTPRCIRPQVFMSNMLQAVSILYKCQLPMLLAFNKVDVSRHEFALEWMADFQVFQEALNSDASVASNLAYSLCMVLDEFYQSMNPVGVSAISGEGMEQLFQAAEVARQTYEREYKPELERRKQKRAEQEAAKKEAEKKKFEKDFQSDQGNEVLRSGKPKYEDDDEDEDEEDDVEDEDEWGEHGDDSEDSDRDDYGW